MNCYLKNPFWVEEERRLDEYIVSRAMKANPMRRRPVDIMPLLRNLFS